MSVRTCNICSDGSTPPRVPHGGIIKALDRHKALKGRVHKALQFLVAFAAGGHNRSVSCDWLLHSKKKKTKLTKFIDCVLNWANR